MDTTIKLGNYSLFRIGLGTNRLTATKENANLLNKAVELGINFIDTAHVYQSGQSETTIGEVLSPYKPGLIIATKGGIVSNLEKDLRSDLETSLTRLKTDRVMLYQLHKVDPSVPIEDSVAVLKKFQEEGKVEHIGLSNVSLDQVKSAQKIATIASVQNHYNIFDRQSNDIVDYCTNSSIIFIPYFPIRGSASSSELDEIINHLSSVHNSSVQQIALAWLLHRSPIILPIPGTLSTEHLKANVEAANIKLNEEELTNLNKVAI